ncbi:uncharacterized protein KY384_003163 [Bacidia gigantensis]|uniref:uncharacterized protein n=1 Tax=Bacidia gigantensis TaxID=2732470 RepID=UPI001D0511F3|nr:uncharacterized protein KY384_003163 [Bacidia gigantensis]KAG8531534.1 hypothetical protein KY384_003163 [Bacidia gigantensis]
MSSKEYDLIVLGANGYTGKNVVEYISTHLPTDLKWAVAGRTHSKLASLVDELKPLNRDRVLPGIEVVKLKPNELHALVKKAKVLINTVGPYHLHGTPVVEACANNGTHYLDVTGESPWVLDIIRKYHETAKQNHAIIIPMIGIESAPPDLLSFALVTLIRSQYSTGVREITSVLHKMKSSPSGGTLSTALTILDSYSLPQIAKANSGDWSSSPVPHPKSPSRPLPAHRRGVFRKNFGVRRIPHLGTCTTSVAAGANTMTVQRTWGLLDKGQFYGPNFQYRDYAVVRNAFVGAIIHLSLAIGILALAIPPLRWLAKKLVPLAPGQGAARDVAKKDIIEFRAVATVDEDMEKPRKAFGRLRFEGGMYYLTGVFLAEAAMVLLKEEKLVEELDGGLLTPAMLGQAFIERMTKAGVVLELEILPEGAE